MSCFECTLDRHALCPDVDVGDHQASDDPDYELVEKFCCCGYEWTEMSLTHEAEYAEMNEQLKPLQWPDAPQPTMEA